jgi:hypothetical protein
LDLGAQYFGINSPSLDSSVLHGGAATHRLSGVLLLKPDAHRGQAQGSFLGVGDSGSLSAKDPWAGLRPKGLQFQGQRLTDLGAEVSDIRTLY